MQSEAGIKSFRNWRVYVKRVINVNEIKLKSTDSSYISFVKQKTKVFLESDHDHACSKLAYCFYLCLLHKESGVNIFMCVCVRSVFFL